MTSFTIGSRNSDHISINISERTQSKIDNPNDYNWLSGSVSVLAGKFTGSYDFTLRMIEIETFRNELSVLYQKLNGVASFETLEDQIKLTLSGNGRGRIVVSGIATDQPGFGNRLNFTFEIDQTYLPNIISELDSIIS